jgi:glycosyltransferase involved in cell wall biosynthesis
MRILAIVNVDVMADLIVKPWLTALQTSGYEVHVACAPGPYMENLRRDGFHIHVLSIQRRFNPLRNLKPILQAWKLIHEYNFQIVNVHSPIGAVVGRIAAQLAGVKRVIYTVHGFYFHENMRWWVRAPIIAIEWVLGRATDCFMFVSEEDRQTALLTGIARDASRTTTIHNAVNSRVFNPSNAIDREKTRSSFGFVPGQIVVGIVGRIAKEKGYREFAAMASCLLKKRSDVRFLVVGDSLSSDRDRFGAKFREQVRAAGMSEQFTFAGFTNDVPRHLRALDIFVLPSYREGFPKSILEAMATGLPVVTTNIRGCREAVIQEETGLIVPPRDADALSAAVAYLVENPGIARAMGQAGLRRSIEVFDEGVVHQRFVDVFDHLRSELTACSIKPGHP